MASMAQLKKRVKTLGDFTKVVNIQKIVVMKEIVAWQKIIEGSRIVRYVFSNIVEKLNKSYSVLPLDYFEKKHFKGRKIPISRKLHFILEGNVADNIQEYEQKVVVEFCKKNNKPEDIYVIVGEDLGKHMKNEGFNVLKVMNLSSLDDTAIYSRIAHSLLTSYNDLIHDGSSFGFLDTTIKKFSQEYIFPIKNNYGGKMPKNMQGFEKLLNINVNKVRWVKDYDVVSQSLIKTAIESLIYQKIVEYSLVMKKRELKSLDDKEKNIKEEIDITKLKMSRIYKDNVTNELLNNATAFSVLSKEEEEEANW